MRLADYSLAVLILSNVFSMGMAWWQQWPLDQIMWIYWGQSVVIGLTNYHRIMSLKDFSTQDLRMNDKPVPETEDSKRSVARFFLLHYGFFHVVYFVFLWQEMPLNALGPDDLALLAFCVAGFFGSHSYSLRYNARADFKHKKPNLGTIMFYPYLRILPMHLTIIFGQVVSGTAILLFMGLKTLADAGMHIVEHRIFQAKSRDPVL